MEGTWELRRESEVHCVTLVLTDSGAGGRNGSSAGQQLLRVQGHGVIKLMASLKRLECRLGPEELEGLREEEAVSY